MIFTNANAAQEQHPIEFTGHFRRPTRTASCLIALLSAQDPLAAPLPII